MEYTYYAYIYAWFFRYSFVFLSSSACAILQYMIKAANASLINLIIWLNIFLKSFYTVLSLRFFFFWYRYIYNHKNVAGLCQNGEGSRHE